MPLFDYTCSKCNNVKEVYYHSTEKILDEIKCNCGSIMERIPGKGQFLQLTSATNILVHRGENKVGTHNLDKSQLPKNRGPRMWKNPKTGGREVGRVNYLNRGKSKD